MRQFEAKILGIVLGVLLASGCKIVARSEPAPSPPVVTEDAGVVTPSQVTWGSAGGSVSVPAAAPFEHAELELPAGIVGEGTTVTIAIAPFPAVEPEVHPELFGTSLAVGLRATVTAPSPELAQAAEAALVVQLSVDRTKLPEEQRVSFEADPVAWADTYLMRSNVSNHPLDHGTTDRCTPAKGSDRPRFNVVLYRIGATGVPTSAKLAVKLLDVRSRGFGAAIGSVAPGQASHADPMHVWYNVKPSAHAVLEDQHFGKVAVDVYPVSVVASPAPMLMPTGADGQKVAACIAEQVRAVGDQFRMNGLRPFARTSAGVPSEVTISVWDYEPGAVIRASTDLTRHAIKMKTTWLDPTAYTPVGARKPGVVDCIANAAGADRLASFSHELFHLQQGEYLAPRTSAATFDYGLRVWGLHRTARRYGDIYVTGDKEIEYPVNDWFREGSARLVEYEMVRTAATDMWSGVTAFSLDRAPWIEAPKGAATQIFHDPSALYWSYKRWPFFKYLLDREPGAKPPLTLLGELLAHMSSRLEEGRVSGYPADKQDYIKWVWEWMGTRDYAGFAREMLLLRGCGLTGDCTAVPASHAQPFGRAPSPPALADLLGNIGTEEAFWQKFATKEFFWQYDDKPYSAWSKATDGGVGFADAASCTADSVKSGYATLPNAEAIRKMPAGHVFALPQTLKLPTTSTRFDIVDDLDHEDGRKYAWRAMYGTACSSKMKTEIYRYGEGNTMKLLAEGKGGQERMFETDKPTFTGPIRLSLLFMMPEWELDDVDATPCEITIKLQVSTCPCATMVKTAGPGGPGDLTLDCVKVGGAKYPLCIPGSFLPGTKTLFTPKEEYRICHPLHGDIAGFCGLGIDAYDAYVAGP